MNTTILLGKETFNKLIIHLRWSLHELDKQTESLLDNDEREEIAKGIEEGEQLIEEAKLEVYSPS